MKTLFALFITFFKIGALSFGGGLAMLPMFQAELSERRGWVTDEELSDYYAVSQCTPGVIAVNTATFVGSKLKGVVGGIVATIGVILPSMIIIGLIAALLSGFADYPDVKNAFAGVRACVVALVLNAIIKLAKSAIKGKASLVIYLACLALALLTPLPVALLVIAAGAAGIVLDLLMRRAGK